MAHRDIKPQNILLTKEGKMKISDFGAAKEQTDKKRHVTPGTRAYASPQQIRCQ